MAVEREGPANKDKPSYKFPICFSRVRSRGRGRRSSRDRTERRTGTEEEAARASLSRR
jgi:hypothetical protein